MRNISMKLFLNSGQWFRRKCCFKIVLSRALTDYLVWSSNPLDNLGRGQYKEHLCKITLNLDKWFRKRCRFKIFLI